MKKRFVYVWLKVLDGMRSYSLYKFGSKVRCDNCGFEIEYKKDSTLYCECGRIYWTGQGS